MTTKLRTMIAIICCAACQSAFAVTGSTPIVAGASGTQYGYNQGFYGAASTPTLSDGRVVTVFSDLQLSAPFTLAMRIVGFTSNPGKSYFNNVIATCGAAPLVFSSVSAINYSYDAATGSAIWLWSRPANCMKVSWGPNYTLSIN